MNTSDARMAGAQAFKKEMPRAPSLNKDFMLTAFASTAATVIDLFQAYIAGWDSANLSKPF